MADLFSDEWMKSFMEHWNAEPELSDALAQIGFNSVIGYGFDGEDQPRGVLLVENGKATSAGAYNGEDMNWDIRASADQWQKWMGKPPGMMGLGMAFTSRKMKFLVGDYGSMVKSFSVMARA